MVKKPLLCLCGIELIYLAALFVLPLMIFPSLRQPSSLFRDPDLWWHLADARILFTQHHFIRFDSYSWTVFGHRWVDSEWLAEVPYWLGYHWAGAFGVYLANWALLELNVVLVFFRAKREAGPAPAFWASTLAILLFVVNAGPRTILAGYVLMSIALWVPALHQERHTKLVWALPALFCVWANTHGTWLIGLFLFALYVAGGYFTLNCGGFRQVKREGRAQRTLEAVFAASVAALFVNPYGWRMVWQPFDMMFRQKLNIASIIEWQPLSLSTFNGKAVVIVIVFMLLSAMLKGRKWKLHEFAWVLFAFYAAFDHVRFTFLVGVIVTPFLARDFTALFWSEREREESRWLNVVVAAALLSLVVYAFPSKREDAKAMENDWPTRLVAMVQPGWRTFNEYKIGGQFAFAGKPDFVDSRVDVFERAGVYADYLNASHIKSPDAVLRKYHVNHILFRQNKPFGYLIAHSPRWQEMGSEGDWVLWKRKNACRNRKSQIR